MSFFELLENTPKYLVSLEFSFLIGTLIAFIFNFGFKFRITGATIFSLLLSLSSWAFIQSYTEKVVIDGAKYVPIVYDNGFDLIIAKAEDDFPEESIADFRTIIRESQEREQIRSECEYKVKKTRKNFRWC